MATYFPQQNSLNTQAPLMISQNFSNALQNRNQTLRQNRLDARQEGIDARQGALANTQMDRAKLDMLIKKRDIIERGAKHIMSITDPMEQERVYLLFQTC